MIALLIAGAFISAVIVIICWIELVALGTLGGDAPWFGEKR